MASLQAFASPVLAARLSAEGQAPCVTTRRQLQLAEQRPGRESTERSWSFCLLGAAGAGLAVARRTKSRRSGACTARQSVAAPSLVSIHRTEAQAVLPSVQAHFVSRLEALTCDGATSEGEFKMLDWLRDGGVHGGGKRLGIKDTPIFNRASVNYSAVKYDDLPEKPISSATALSVIIHPRNPFAPSMHCHFSYTESRRKAPYWRMISDLNPSLHNPGAKNQFEKALKNICPPDLFDDGKLFGDKYFFIPELNMYRGTSHLFIAELSDTEMAPQNSRKLAEDLAIATINTYTDIVQQMMDAHPTDTVSEHHREQQLAYHTAYFYQVLFLDCGTTAGLLTHSENDVGTLASLPSYINVSLLRTWLEEKVQPPHDILLKRMLAILPAADGPCPVKDETRAELAKTVREYYQEDMTRTKSQADMDLAWWATRAK